MGAVSPDRRLLLVHAHPDDEAINNGATMARYVAEDVHVTLLTCTLGEEGEVLVPELAQLAADQADQLGGYRIGELAAAMAALGVTDHRFLRGGRRGPGSRGVGTPPPHQTPPPLRGPPAAGGGAPRPGGPAGAPP